MLLKMNNRTVEKLKNLESFLSIFFGILFSINSVFGNTLNQPIITNDCKTNIATIINQDSIKYSTIVLYRPDNQLNRKYKISTNINGAFEMSKKEVVKIDVNSNTFLISVDAVGHKKEYYTFVLSPSKTHYFRIQDRNNYSGFRAFLEVIEVTEETFKRENF